METRAKIEWEMSDRQRRKLRLSHPTLSATVPTILTLILHLPSAEASVINVPEDYTTIQDAIDVAKGGDLILVAAGKYTGAGNYNLDFGGKDLIIRSAGGSPFFCKIDANNLGRIFLFQNGETDNAVIEGFTLSNGNADDGGAIFCDNGSSPTIRKCRFVQNEAVRGGAVFADGDSHPKIESCTFRNNLAIKGGALAAFNFSSPDLNNCTFVRNSASLGGAIHGSSSWGTLFEEPVIEDCIFLNNTAAAPPGSPAHGGAIYFHQSSPYFSRCIFRGNETKTGLLQDGFGGALYNHKSSPFLISCLFDGNRAKSAGAIYNDIYSAPAIVNCTIVNNESELAAGGVWVTRGLAVLSNSVFWGNHSEIGSGNQVWDDPVMTGGDDVFIFYSIVEGGWENGFSVFDLDPEFLNPAAGDYRVSQSSPCVDLGNLVFPCFPSCVPEGETLDLNHDPRIVCEEIDAGAFEVQFLVCHD